MEDACHCTGLTRRRIGTLPSYFSCTDLPVPTFHTKSSNFQGGSHSKYITNFAHYMTNVISKSRSNKPWRISVFERRGCGMNPLINEVPFTYANVDDLRQVVRHIKTQFPDAPLVRNFI